MLTQETPAPQAAVGALDLGAAFLAALAARDYAGLEACFAADAAFQALVPRGLRAGTGPAEAVGWLRRWFGAADRLVLEAASVALVVDRLHVSYGFRVHEDGVWTRIEQQAYCVVADGRIQIMHVLCSGFRPLEESSGEPA